MSSSKSKIKHAYWEVKGDYSLTFQKAEVVLKDELYNSFSCLPGFEIVHKNLISFIFGNQRRKAAIFWLRAEGNPDFPYTKRIELTKKKLIGFDCEKDFFIAVYKFETNVTFLSLKLSAKSLEGFHPTNPTSLTKVHTDDLLALENKIYHHLRRDARFVPADIFLSKSLGLLLTVTESFANSNLPPNLELRDGSEAATKAFETPDSNEIGRDGEVAFDNLLKNVNDKEQDVFLMEIENKIGQKILEHTWNNAVYESYLPYDFVLNTNCHLELKTSSVKDAKSFIISPNEVNHSKSWPNYFLAFISVDRQTTPCKILSLRLFDRSDLDNIRIEPRSFFMYPEFASLKNLKRKK